MTTSAPDSVPLHAIVSQPRTDFEAFCKECGLSFTLLDESPLRTTCRECWEKLGRPALECEECGKAIPPGDKCHLEWTLWCRKCAKYHGKSDEKTYKCQTVAWSG